MPFRRPLKRARASRLAWAGAALCLALTAACSRAPVVTEQPPGLSVVDGRPVLRGGERLVLDVSVHQGGIDWQRAAGDGVAGAYVKASEGGDFRDRRFADNWRALRRAGLQRGAYHYFTFCRHGAEQAANFLAAAPPDKAALAPAIDIETAGNCSLRPMRADLLAELQAFLRPIEAAWGREVVLYTSYGLDTAYGLTSALDRPLWVRSIDSRPGGDWRLWQASATGRVAGIAGRVDLNVLRSEP